MLVVPIIGKISLKNPPFMTIALILINTLVYFGFQWNDNEKQLEAWEYYMTSDLPKIELLYYQAYVDGQKILPITEVPRKMELDAIEDVEEYDLLYQMLEDDKFRQLVDKNEVIMSDHELFARWKDQKDHYKKIINETAVFQYGLTPATPKWHAFLTCMFLHGGFGHLFGNMVFLWLVGCFLEMGCGRIYYFVMYIISGVAASAAFMLVYPDSTLPLVGASGAIAGMMGAFAVLFGKKKVKIFFSLGFYFGYRTLTGIFLLPVWLLNECYQLFFSGASHVAYVAHIGGIVAGALLAQINLKTIKSYDENAIASDDEPVDQISPLIEKALEHIGNLDMDKGRNFLEQALERDPLHVSAMTHLFNVLKNNPHEERFHSLTKDFLNILITKPATHKKALKTLNDYETITGKLPKLSPEAYVRIGVLYAYDEQPEASHRILSAILKQKPTLPSIPPAMLKLADAYKKKGQIEEFKNCLQMIMDKFPGSNESQVANTFLFQGAQSVA